MANFSPAPVNSCSLDLLEPNLFASRELLLESVEKRENPLFLRRLKELYNAVTAYVEESYNRALAKEKRNVAFALLILQRRLASSVRAARRSLERRHDRLKGLLKLGRWLAERGEINEELLEDLEEAERLKREEELLERLTAAETREELEREIAHLGELIRLAKRAERREVETKLRELKKVMEAEQLRQTGEKLLIFTESRDTLDYLVEKIGAWGYPVVALHGGMDLDTRIRAERQFRDQAQVMVSTEAGGEGINLQFCSLMVNYDIPWNPNRLEQRMGRIHRYGQRNEVHIYNREIEAVPDKRAVARVREATLEALATRHIDLTRVLGETRKARENRLVPEYIERFFERACKRLGVPAERRGDGLWRVSRVPDELRNVSKAFKDCYGEVFREYRKIAFDKAQARRHQAEFCAPGHPLLEAIIETFLAKGEREVRRGATFADPNGRLDGLLWFFEAEIRDGNDQVAGRRLLAIYQDRAGDLRTVSPAILWDLKPLARRGPKRSPLKRTG